MTVKDLKLRRFLPEDMERILEIGKASFVYPYARSYFEKPYRKYPRGFIVAEMKGKVIGYVNSRMENDTAKIVSLAVDAAFRRMGVGRALFDFLLGHFREAGLKKAKLYVRVGNKTAITFHRSFDFEIVKTIIKHYPDGEDGYLMEKEL